MPKQRGVAPPAGDGLGQEAAKKLLAGERPEGEELRAGIEALGNARSVEAANVLQALDGPKDVVKAARRALFKLQTQGFKPAAAPPAPAEAPERPKSQAVKLLEARVSSYDPRGTRAVSILAEKPFTGLVSLFAIASDTDGLLDADLTSTTKKSFFARLDNFSREYSYIEFVPVAAEYANQIVFTSAGQNEQSQRPLPQDFAMWKTFGITAPEPPLEAPIYGELDLETVEKLSLDETKELAHTEFEAWVYDEERLKTPLARLDTAKGGPLVLSEDAQKGREQTIVDEATDEIFTEAEVRLAKIRLEETAHFLFSLSHRDAAERCLRAALDVATAPPHSQPFLRELVAKSVHLLTHNHEQEHGEPEPAAEIRTDSGIVLPA